MTEMSNTSNKVNETYKNTRLSFEEKPDHNKIILQIGEKSIEVIKKDDEFYSSYLLYNTYPSVSELTKKVNRLDPRC